MDPKNIFSLDANMWVEVCGEGIVRIWQTNSVCGRQMTKCLTFNRARWVDLLCISHCIDADIEAILTNVAVDKQYHIGAGFNICIKNPSQCINIQSWVRLENQHFKPSIRAFKVTFAQWKMLMDANIARMFC